MISARHPVRRLVPVLLAVVAAAGFAAASLTAGPAAWAEETRSGPAVTAAGDCAVTDASLVWGFKEAFRSYISGSIANGEWTTAGGATYATPDFSWADGTGDIDPETGAGLLAFTGSIEFTGHGGILDTTVADPQVRFDDAGSATLLLDVSGTTQAGDEISEVGVEFASVDLGAATRTVDGSTLTFTGAPTVLLPAGAEAFGTYEAGEEFDPITVTITTSVECGPIAVALPTPPTTSAPAKASGSDPAWMWWALAGILFVATAVVVATVLIRRSRPSS